MSKADIPMSRDIGPRRPSLGKLDGRPGALCGSGTAPARSTFSWFAPFHWPGLEPPANTRGMGLQEWRERRVKGSAQTGEPDTEELPPSPSMALPVILETTVVRCHGSQTPGGARWRSRHSGCQSDLCHVWVYGEPMAGFTDSPGPVC